MVNTLGLDKAKVLEALAWYAGTAMPEDEAKRLIAEGHRGFGFKSTKTRDTGTVNLMHDDGFHEDDFDRVFGRGAAQAAIDRLREVTNQ